MINLTRTIPTFTLLLSLLPLGGFVASQIPGNKKTETKSEAKTDDKRKLREVELIDSPQRAFATSLLMSLADEARGYRNLALRARVLARTGDTLWDVDNEAARGQFRRAWEAAEQGDAEETSTVVNEGRPGMVIALGSMSSSDLRSEVLTLAARRDPGLGQEFLKKLTDDKDRESSEAPSKIRQANEAGQAVSKRLLLARRLLDEGQIERALEFAAPVLNHVNQKTISFLSALRAKRAELADEKYLRLLAQVELDPSSDANTVSGLSSYAFTPGLYVTFSADGGVALSTPERPIEPPNLPGAVRRRFFQVATNILLRPLLPADQDPTSAGRQGKYMVIKRLLPLFEQYAPDTAVSLRSLLATLTSELRLGMTGDDDFLIRQGIQTETGLSDGLEKMQDRLDHAANSRERDAIYTDVATSLAAAGDLRAQELADKIDNGEWRAMVREYVDVSLVQAAARKRDALLVAKLAKAGLLSHTQRAWAYTLAARLLMKSQRRRALELLEEGLAEARRIEADDPNRIRTLIGAATQFLVADHVRAWEIMTEAVKAADAVEDFSGDDEGIRFAIATSSGIKFIEISGSDLSLVSVVRLLAREDLTRASDLAKSFKNDAPRAMAILGIAAGAFEKRDKLR